MIMDSSSKRPIGEKYISIQDDVSSALSASLIQIESQPIKLVKELSQPLFMIFDYFEVTDPTYANIVNNFVEGRLL